MRRCMELALLGSGRVAPNPMVGSLLVHDNTVIGEGYHMKYGEAHAEVNCISSVKQHNLHLIPDSTLYVSLEPCSHFGKTPPCTDLITRHRIKKVVVACEDPYEKVNGSGIAKLTAAGISVVTGVSQTEALEVNKRFFTFHREKRPYIILKWAQSKNDKISQDDPGRTYISSPHTNILVHKWRSEEGAIMVGTTTALKDDPSLTTRLWPGSHPLRIIIDKQLRLSENSMVLKDEYPAIILNSIRHVEGNKLFHKTSEEENLLTTTLKLLHQRNILSLIVEGGAALIGSFIDAGLWDEARVITNSRMYIDKGTKAPALTGARLFDTINIGSDKVQFFTNAKRG